MRGGIGRIASDRLRVHRWARGSVVVLRGFNSLFRFGVRARRRVIFVWFIHESVSALLHCGLFGRAATTGATSSPPPLSRLLLFHYGDQPARKLPQDLGRRGVFDQPPQDFAVG